MTSMASDLPVKTQAAAIKSNLHAFFQLLQYSPLAAAQKNAHALRWHTPVAHPWFNGVLSTQAPTEGAGQYVEDTLAYFKSQNVSSFTWWTSPKIEPAAWGRHLLPHGFRYENQTPGMAIDLDGLPPAERHAVTIRRVEDQDTLAVWADTFTRGYGIPEWMAADIVEFMISLGTDLPFYNYLGYLDGEAVATSTLFPGAGVAGIYNVSTIPTARGKGIGCAMTLTPLYDGRDMGYHTGVLQSSSMGFKMYQRLGFRSACQIDYFHWQA